MPKRSPLLAAFALLAACAGQPSRHADHVHGDTAHFPISCDCAVQTDFDRAIVLLHHMTYPQARAAFERIAARDPQCAIAEWGVAITLFQPLWPTRPNAEERRLGWNAVQRAQTIGTRDAREEALIAATAAFFRDPASDDYWPRIQRWSDAMASAHAAFPDDAEVSAFYALSLLATSKPGPTAEQHSREAVALLKPVLAANPHHPGAMHYVIHADDMPGRERDDLELVRAYETIAPDNPHALHMPTHIYTRLGDWDGVIRGNLRAADAALKYPAGTHGEYVWDEFPHAIEYLAYAYLQKGEDERAKAEIDRLQSTPKLEPTTKTAFHLASTRARYALERRDWARAASLAPREPATLDWNRSPWPEAIVCFARGYGAMRTGALDESERMLARIGALETRASAAGEDVFARQIRILKFETSAWIAHARRDDAAALAELRDAVALEAATPKPAVTPAPTLPAAEQLGDLLLELDRPHEAADAYASSLRRYPNRFDGTLGAARALAQAGDVAGAASRYCELLALAPHGTRTELGEARAFAGAHGPCPRASDAL